MASVKKHRALIIAVCVLAILAAAFAIYLNTYYRTSDDGVLAAALNSTDTKAGEIILPAKNCVVYLVQAASNLQPFS